MKLGFIESEEKKKLSFKFTKYTKILEPGVDHHKSLHTLALQRSKYICVDENIDKEFVMKNHFKKNLMDKIKKERKLEKETMCKTHSHDDHGKKTDIKRTFNNNDLNIRFCPEQEIQ